MYIKNKKSTFSTYKRYSNLYKSLRFIPKIIDVL